MDKISETQKSLKKKLSLENYSNTICQDENIQIIIDSKRVEASKFGSTTNIRWLGDPVKPKKKMTFYLTRESEVKLNEIFSRRLMNNEKVDKSILINRAVELLWNEEKKNEI